MNDKVLARLRALENEQGSTNARKLEGLRQMFDHIKTGEAPDPERLAAWNNTTRALYNLFEEAAI